MTTIPDILDNSEGRKVGEVVWSLLLESPQPPSIDIATAYFNLAGFAMLEEGLRVAKRVRLLFGKEQEQEFVLGEALWEDLQEALSTGEPPRLIEALEQLLSRDEVEVRVLGNRLQHGKTYILEGVPLVGRLAIVGSSNFTAGGLDTNDELNTVQKQDSAVQAIKGWFERFWDEAEDYKAEFLRLVRSCTGTYTPYEIYMKALYEYFKDTLQLTSVSETPDNPSPISLADFQNDGYRAAKEILEKYGGVLIADSVGLGKTYLALKLLDDHAYQRREKALLVCPAQLHDVLWQRELGKARIYVDIEHMERVSRSDFEPGTYRDYDLVVVDESHNFRNAGTNRWRNLFRLLTEDKPKKLLLLTATPVNNSIFDLFQQLRLIVHDRQDFFAAAGIPHLWGYFNRAQEQRENLYEVLEEIAVRRSRDFIRKNYPDAKIDGKPVHFPERRLHTADYSLETSYQGLHEEVARTLEDLNLAPYNVEAYRKTARQVTLFDTLMEELVKSGWPRQKAREYLWKLGRQAALVGILKMLYLKRLESSVEAFRVSIDRQVRFQRQFLQCLKQGRVLDGSSYRRLFLPEASDDISEESELAADGVLEQLPELDAEQYDLGLIEKAVEEDLEGLSRIQSGLEGVTAANDAKLAALKYLLTTELKGRKVVVFTYFRDTARYLYRHLGGGRQDGRLPPGAQDFLQALGHDGVSIVDSMVKPKERTGRINRFAPLANEQQLGTPNRAIDLLISTDVLSEGQNLQDADTVINYDLHWNPVRMVQRAGRIDRIGSPHDTVHVYNFVPEDALESLLGIMERLYEKLESINRSVGLDASVMGERPNPQEFNALRRIAKADESVWDELEGESELDIGEFLRQELLDFIRRESEKKLERMPIGAGSGMHREGTSGIFVGLRDKVSNRHTWLYYDRKDRKFVGRKLQAIRMAKCGPDEKRVETDFDVYELLARAKRHVLNLARQTEHRLTALKHPQNAVASWLHMLPPGEERDALFTYFSTPLTGLALKELRSVWRETRGGDAQLFSALCEFAETHPHPTSEPPAPRAPEAQELEVICWLALV